MKATTAAAAAAVTLVVVGVAVAAIHTTDVDFTLTMDAGTCQPSDPPEITAGYLRKVHWTVTNVNCPAQYISLRNFKPAIGDPSEEVVKPDPVEGGPIPTGESRTLEAKVVKFRLWHKVFKYEIWLGETPGTLVMRRDPDIDVWPF